MAIQTSNVKPLTIAERNLLTLEYCYDEKILTEVDRFAGKNIDELENLDATLIELSKMDREFQVHKSDYDKENSQSNPSEIIKVGLDAMGREVLKRKKELQNTRTEVLGFGEKLFRSLVDHMISRTLKNNFTFLGQNYGQFDGKLTIPTEVRKYPIVIFTTESSALGNYVKSNWEVDKKLQTYPKIANDLDYRLVLDSIFSVRKFM